MAKVLIAVSAANAFLDADGLLNMAALARLQGKIETFKKKNPDSKVGPSFLIAKKAKPVKFSAVQEKKGDHKYLLARAVKVVSRTRVTPTTLAKAVVILENVAGLPKELAAEVKTATSAITQHIRKLEKVVGKVKTEKGKIRDTENAEFDKNIESLKAILFDGGLKEAAIVEGRSMFGKTVFVKLPNGGVISIGKSNADRMKAAVKAAKEAEAA